MDQANFVGNILSLDCGESLGTFQGVVTAVNKDRQTVSLKDTFRNGVKYEVPEVTISAVDIKDLKILKVREAVLPDQEKENKKPCNGSGEGSGKKNLKPQQVTRKSHSKSPIRKGTPNKSGSASVGHTPQKPERGKQRHSAFHSPVGKRRENKSDVESRDADDGQDNFHLSRSKSFSSASNLNKKDKSPNRNHRKKAVNGKGGHFTIGGDSTDDEIPRNDRGRRRNKSGGDGMGNGRYRSSPMKVESKRRSFHQAKNDECFSAPVESFLDDFDFGKNLALFDKAAVFEEIDAMTDGALFGPKKREIYLKAHENVLDDDEKEKTETVTDGQSGNYFYLSENGIKVPAMSPEDRANIFTSAEKAGFSQHRRIETIGVCCAQLVLGLLGGCQRLKPGNKHQKPTIVLLCGSHIQGAQGVCCGRFLSQHCARVIVCIPGDRNLPTAVSKEVELFRQTEGQVILSPQDLPASPVDLIISALHTPAKTVDNNFSKSAIQWATHNKACILSLDPCKHQEFNSKWSIFVGVPLHGSASLGNIYLCDPGIPKRFYQSLVDKYIFPFGSKFVIPLEDT